MNRSYPPLSRALLFMALLLIVGCSSSTEENSDPSTTTISPTSVTSPEDPAPTASVVKPTTTSDSRIAENGVELPAEVGSEVPGLLLWDKSEVRKQNLDGEWATLVEGQVIGGRLIELVEVPDHGIAFQLEQQETSIWLKNDEAVPVEIVVGTEGQWLELEGAGYNPEGEVLVFYQRHVGSTPPTRRSTLRSFNLDTQEVQELAETGGWESGTSFSHISDGVVVANWGSQGFSGTSLFDLDEGRFLDTWDDSDPLSFECECPTYLQATIIDGVIYGIKEMQVHSAEADQEVVTYNYDLYTYDVETRNEELISDFVWDRRFGFPEYLFEFDGHLIVSIIDGDGDPLPALVWRLDDGAAWTLPGPGFARRSADA